MNKNYSTTADYNLGQLASVMFRKLLFQSIVFQKGNLIYGSLAGFKKNRIVYFIKLAILIIFSVRQTFVWLETESMFSLVCAGIGIIWAFYIWYARKLSLVRSRISEEFLAMWMLNNLPNSNISVKQLLEPTIVKGEGSESNKIYALLINKEATYLYCYNTLLEDPTSQPPEAVYLVERNSFS